MTLNGEDYPYTPLFNQVQLWNIAHKASGQEQVLEFKTRQKEELNFTDYSLVKADGEAIKHILNNRFEQGMTIEEMSNTSIEGSIHITDRSDTMMTTIPYSPGWTVKIDGKTVKTKQAWGSLLAFPITSGPHRISLTFRPPGLTTGLAISLFSILILIRPRREYTETIKSLKKVSLFHKKPTDL